MSKKKSNKDQNGILVTPKDLATLLEKGEAKVGDKLLLFPDDDELDEKDADYLREASDLIEDTLADLEDDLENDSEDEDEWVDNDPDEDEEEPEKDSDAE